MFGYLHTLRLHDSKTNLSQSDLHPFSLILLISSVGFFANKMKCYYITAHRRSNHSIVAECLITRLLNLQCLFSVSGLHNYALILVTQISVIQISVTFRNADRRGLHSGWTGLFDTCTCTFSTSELQTTQGLLSWMNRLTRK